MDINVNDSRLVAKESLMNLAGCLESSSKPTHACRALCRAATEIADNVIDQEDVAENISVNTTMSCVHYLLLFKEMDKKCVCNLKDGQALHHPCCYHPYHAPLPWFFRKIVGQDICHCVESIMVDAKTQ